MSAALHIVAVGTHPRLTLVSTPSPWAARHWQGLGVGRREPVDPDLEELALLSEQVAHDPDATPPPRYFELLAKSQKRMI